MDDGDDDDRSSPRGFIQLENQRHHSPIGWLPHAYAAEKSEPLDPNTVTADQLKALPGIGDAYFELVFGKVVPLYKFDTDKYGRTLADVLLPDGANVNPMLVKDGWYWWYRKYALADTVLEGWERDAREVKKGLSADPASVPPWEGRKGSLPKGKNLNGLLRVREWGCNIVLESELMAWRVGHPRTFSHSEATRNERSFEEERQRTLRQRERTAKHPLPCRGRGISGE